MSNFKDSISPAELKALYANAQANKKMTQDAPWKGTQESVGNPELGIVQQAIDAVDDNCEFSIGEFLKGSHYSLYLYIRNIETTLAGAIEAKADMEAIVYLSTRLGELNTVYESLTNLLPPTDEDGIEEEEDENV